MIPGADIARIWPSAAALERGLKLALEQSPRGFLAEPQFYTWDNFLPSVLEQAPLPHGWQALLPLAGPLLVRQIIAQHLDHPLWSVYAGQAMGRKLPRRLWRLLVEVKSSGLAAGALSAMPSPRVRALSLLLSEYDCKLKELRLLDQADCLAILENGIKQGHRPGLLALWAGVAAEDVLWLRSMDLRLLRALGGIMPVNLRFALSPPPVDPKGVFKLLEATARVLEGDRKERIAIQWRDEDEKGLGSVVEALLAGRAASRPAACPGAELKLLLAPGRYAEVSMLMDRAQELLGRGVAAGEIVLAFPDLEIYGQMCLDLAGRIGIPLELDQGRGLAASPLVSWLISLLELPSIHFRRQELARVLGSPFAALLPFAEDENLARGPWGSGGLERRLRGCGYQDSRELMPEETAPFGNENLPFDSLNSQNIHRTTGKIARFANNLYTQKNIKGFIESISSLLGRLRSPALSPAGPGSEKNGIFLHNRAWSGHGFRPHGPSGICPLC